ncbi:MAG: M20/M25/M40 family metallo-hydrolase, partial [Acidobacteriota bacterium]
VTQKRPLWLTVTATGRGGHASGLRPRSATHRLVEALARLVERPLQLRMNAAVQQYLAGLARLEGGRSVELLEQLESGVDPATFSLPPGMPVYFLDTIQVTEIDNGKGSNVIAPVARASVDIRLLPDSDSDAFLAEIRELLGSEVEVEVVLDSPPADASPTEHPIFRALEEALEVRAPVVPTFIAGTTDSRYFRQRGIPAYGFSPFSINAEDLRGIHGRNESIPVDAFLRGIETLRRVLQVYVGNLQVYVGN